MAQPLGPSASAFAQDLPAHAPAARCMDDANPNPPRRHILRPSLHRPSRESRKTGTFSLRPAALFGLWAPDAPCSRQNLRLQQISADSICNHNV